MTGTTSQEKKLTKEQRESSNFTILIEWSYFNRPLAVITYTASSSNGSNPLYEKQFITELGVLGRMTVIDLLKISLGQMKNPKTLASQRKSSMDLNGMKHSRRNG